jgi:hypothetical protein
VNLTPLPRSLDPLPAESLPGYLLRLAHRLELSPTRLTVLTGLSTGEQSSTASSIVLFLPPDTAARFAHATRLSTAEVAELTLAGLAPRYPPLDLQATGRSRKVHGLLIRENWIFARSTRYCPDCLAGDGSTIQQRHGGGWSKLWRLPVVFACPAHRRLLRHTCPACHAPAHQRRPGSVQWLPLAAHPVTHPAACRNTTTDRAPFHACGQRLDDEPVTVEPAAATEEALLLQRRLLNLLVADPPPEANSLQKATTPSRYFIDLRIVSGLLQASWPAGRDLVDTDDADLLDVHVRSIRHQIASARSAGRRAPDMLAYDRPPADARTAAILLTTADQLLASDPATAQRALRTLWDAAPFARAWTKQSLTGDGHCSPGLRTVAGIQTRARHVTTRLGLPVRPVQPPPQPVNFGPRHIPQYLPIEWHDQHFATVTAIEPRWIRRAVPVLLARTCLGGNLKRAAPAIGLPWSAGRHAVNLVTAALRDAPGPREDFHTAMNALQDNLHNAPLLIDYGARRGAMATWSISPQDWRHLIQDLVGKPVNGKAARHIDWSDRKRLLASIWVWTRLTQGEPYFAPLLRPDPAQPKPGGELSAYIHPRWPFILAGHGHYADLRSRLDAYADDLAQRMNDEQPGTWQRPTTPIP